MKPDPLNPTPSGRQRFMIGPFTINPLLIGPASKNPNTIYRCERLSTQEQIPNRFSKYLSIEFQRFESFKSLQI